MKMCNPNQEVERWKDAVYEETRGMSKRKLDGYFQRQLGVGIDRHPKPNTSIETDGRWTIEGGDSECVN